MARHEPDKSSKWLIQHHGGSILRLAGISGNYRWKAMQAEIVLPKRLPDGLLEVHFAGQSKPDYVLLEMATYPEKRVPKQVVDDLTLALAQLGVLPEVLTVILARKGKFQVSGHFEMQSRLHWSRLAVGWKVVELWNLSAEELLALNDVGVIPWVPLTHFEGPPEELFRRCRERIEQQAPANQEKQITAVSQVLASLRYTDMELLSLLGGKKRMSEFPLIQEFINETRHEDIVQFLKARFGEEAESLRPRLQKITREKKLNELVRFAAICSDLKAFQARLRS